MTLLRAAAASVALIMLGAWSPSPAAVAAAEAGKVWHSVVADKEPGVQIVRAVVDIDAPPPVVWKIMVDCASARRVIPSNRGCRVLERKPGSEIIEHILKTPLNPKVRSVFRQDLETNKRIGVTRVDGDLKVLEGEYRLQPLPGGRTRVYQEIRMQPGFAAPGPLVRSFLRDEVSVGFANLRRDAEAAAAKS